MDKRDDRLEEVDASKLTKMLVSNSCHYSCIRVDIVEAAHGKSGNSAKTNQ